MKLAQLRPRLASGWLPSVACAVALLHYGQPVLQPLALALILSLVMAPLVRAVRGLGLSRRVATIASVAVVGSVLLAAAAVLAFQLAAAAADLPKYRIGLLAKIEQVRTATVSPLERWRSELGMDEASPVPNSAQARTESAAKPAPMSQDAAEPVPRVLGFIWRAVAQCGIVLVLLVFILLDHDALRDRLLRLAGRADLASAAQVLGDAASGVARFFLAQFIVNLCLGVSVGTALWAIGVPHAALFGALAGVLRFLPYFGMLAAGVLIAGFAAAVDPGWSLVLQAAGVLLAVELVVANAIEPHVYGHSSGLAPAAIIVSALFWGAVGGPVGLVLSTPLTLCLVLCGRHVRALEPIAIVFGDTPGVTRGQQLYHRALAGELRDIEDEARSWLRRRSFASFCDHVLLPALALAGSDQRAGRLQEAQLLSLRTTLAGLVESLGFSDPGRRFRRPRPLGVLAGHAGPQLRQVRRGWMESGPAPAPECSTVLCTGLRGERYAFETELLARTLAEAGLDARSVPLARGASGCEAGPEPAGAVSTVFVCCPQRAALAEWHQACSELRMRFPGAVLATVRKPLDASLPGEAALRSGVHVLLHSFSEALAFVQTGGDTTARTHAPLAANELAATRP